MTDREALFRAVLGHPDDDTPRLIFADFLQEEGEPDRAAFIRSQVALARVPAYDPLWVRARHHEPHLFSGAEWADELPDLPGGLRWQPEAFRRGFPAAVRAQSGDAFATHADELFALAPVEDLVVPMLKAREPDLSDCPWLRFITTLSLPEGMSRVAAAWVLNSPLLERLTELHVGSGLTPSEAAWVIVESKAFARLTAFGCRDDSRTHAVVEALVRLADPPSLERLDLSSNRITAEPLARLLGSPALSGVAQLDLSDNTLRADGLRALAAADLPALRSLRLLRTGPELAGVRALAESPRTANLRVLDLGENIAGTDAAVLLAESPHVRNLIALDLSGNLIEDGGADALAASPYLENLIALDVSSNLFTPPAAARLRDRFGDRVIL